MVRLLQALDREHWQAATEMNNDFSDAEIVQCQSQGHDSKTC